MPTDNTDNRPSSMDNTGGENSHFLRQRRNKRHRGGIEVEDLLFEMTPSKEGEASSRQDLLSAHASRQRGEEIDLVTASFFYFAMGARHKLSFFFFF